MWYIISCQQCCLILEGKMRGFCITLHFAILQSEASRFWESGCLSADTALSLPVSYDLGGFLNLCHLKSQ